MENNNLYKCYNPSCRKRIKIPYFKRCFGESEKHSELSAQLGLAVPLCRNCCIEALKGNTELTRFLHRAGEKAFIESHYPNDTQAGISAFRVLFGKNYLFDTRKGEWDMGGYNIPESVDMDDINKSRDNSDEVHCERCGKLLFHTAYEDKYGNLFCDECFLYEHEVSI